MIDTSYLQLNESKCPVCGSFGYECDDFLKCPLCDTKFTEFAILELGHKRFSLGNN
jgi:rubrerythrin